MLSHQQKIAISGKKLQIKKKIKSIEEETLNVTKLLEDCISKFQFKLKELEKCNQEIFFESYESLNNDLDKHQETIYLVIAAIDGSNEDAEEQLAEDVQESNDVDNVLCKEKETSVNKFSNNAELCEFKDVCLFNQNSSFHISHTSLKDFKTPDALPLTDYHNLYETIPKQLKSSPSASLESFENHNDCHSQKGPEVTNLDNAQISNDVKVTLNNASLSNSNKHNNVELSVSSDQTLQNMCLLHNSLSSFSSEEGTNSLYNSEELSIANSDLFIPFQSISMPSKVPASLIHVIDLSNFWIQIENSRNKSIDYKPYFEKSKSLPFVKCGSFCLVSVSLGTKSIHYYRAEVLNDSSSNEQVNVLCVDYGYIYTVNRSDIRYLPEKCYKQPRRAINCYLFNIIPINNTWSSKAITKLKEYQSCSIQIDIVEQKKDMYGVKLYLVNPVSLEASWDIANFFVFGALCKTVKEETESDHHEPVFHSSDSGVSITSLQSHKYSQSCLISTKCANNLDNECNTSQENYEISKLPVADNSSVVTNLVLKSAEADYHVNLENKQKFNEVCLPLLDLKVFPPNLSFVADNLIIVIVSNVIDPSEFYVNNATNDGIMLDELRDSMTHIYESVKINIPLEVLKEGMFCAGRFSEDRNWYRVKILQISEVNKEKGIFVQYIDYGNKAWLNSTDLQPLMADFVECSAFAIKCCLAGITPKCFVTSTNLNESSQKWDLTSVQRFKELTKTNKLLTAEICQHYENDEILHVLLWDTVEEKDIMINQMLVEENLAEVDDILIGISSEEVSFKDNNDDCTLSTLDKWDPMFEDYDSIENSYGVRVEDAQVAVSGYKQRDESYVCKNYSLHGVCRRVNCKFEHLTLLEGGATRDCVPEYALSNCYHLPDVSSHVLVQISTVIHPRCFYAIFPYGNTCVNDADSSLRSGTENNFFLNYEAKELFKALNARYSSEPFQENTMISLSIGNIVIAWREDDKSWHRGRVVEISHITHPAKVFFVDFGNEEWVPRKKIRTIYPEFLHTPFQAVECCLFNIQPLGLNKNKFWSDKAINRFIELVHDEVLLAEIIHRSGESLHIFLRKTLNGKYLRIEEQLVADGYAEKVTFTNTGKKESIYVPG